MQRTKRIGDATAGDPQSWQPIEMAPQDGTRVLVHGERGPCVAEFHGSTWYAIVDGDFAYYGDSDEMRDVDPTHWMPLPDPPGV
jgi:hypothetical protein